MNRLPQKIWLAVTVILGAILIAPGSIAAEADVARQKVENILEEVIVVGMRRQNRTVLDTPVPVDVFGLEDLASDPSPELLDVLTTLVPSLNVIRQSLGDGLSFMRQPQMRGMDSDKTLVLVNGKRRHRGALVQLSGFGSNGPDMASIPSIALRNVEVLRDGASALYGSDAIAGVINMNLRDASRGGEIHAQYGKFSLGNEDAWLISGNVGMPLGNDGFVNISFEWNDAEQTSRGGLYDRTLGQSGLTPSEAALVSGLFDHDGDPATPDQQRFGPDVLTELWIDGQLVSLFGRSDGVPDDTDTRFADNLSSVQLSDHDLVMLWGRPEREAFSTVVNAEYELPVEKSLYGWATFSESDTNRPATHRRVGRGGMLPVRTSDGAIYDSRVLYPAGFTPQFFGEITDYSVNGGMRGKWDNELSWDFGGRYGRSELQYSMTNSMNPSLGPSTPTSFKPGGLISEETAITADFTRPLSLGFAEEPFLAFGFEFREEGYKSELGDPASFAVGPYSTADPWGFETSVAEAVAGENGGVVECRLPGLESIGTPCPALDPIHNILSPASESFPGFSPLSVFDYERDSWSVYADLELDISESFLLTVAGRYEDFSDFGDNFSWRVAGRYEINDSYALRASAGTGFRAPTPGQIASLSVRSVPGQTREPTLSGVFPPSHPAAQVFGAVPLDAETSSQWSLGLTAVPVDNLTLSLDFYHIAVDDRFNRSSTFDVGDAEREVLVASGVPGASAIGEVSFFNNDIDTESDGVDLVATWNQDWSGGLTTLSLAANWNKTEVTRRTPRENGFWLRDADVFNIENGTPRPRGNISIRHRWSSSITFFIRGNWYGSYTIKDTRSEQLQKHGSVLQVDTSLSWNLKNDRYKLIFGGNNIFDQQPDPLEFDGCCGLIVRRSSIMDWQGPYYYVRASYQWD